MVAMVDVQRSKERPTLSSDDGWMVMAGGAGAADADADDAADDEDEDEDDEDEAQRCFYQHLGLRPIYTSGGLSLYTIVRSP
jgi:hypothetical protein